MKNLDTYDLDQVIADLTYMMVEEFDEQVVPESKAQQLLLNVLADHEIGCAIRRKAKAFVEAEPEWVIAGVGPTPDPARALVTIRCPACGEGYWYKVRIYRPEETENRAPKECPACSTKLKKPRMILF